MLYQMKTEETAPLIIIGAGAAGLMAACHAGEYGIPTLLLERKHRAGSKLLMCGNGRCNLTSALDVSTMLSDFGPPLDAFLSTAIGKFPPAMLQKWFERNNLPLMLTRDGKVFPKSEKAMDVVRCLTDVLRRQGTPICYSAPVQSVDRDGEHFVVRTSVFQVHAKRILICTGGVSYPKTGSVGDGQRIARDLGHKVRPFRPGLVGVDWDDPWLHAHRGEQFKAVDVRVFDGKGCIGETSGLLECENWGLGGGAISNATRLLSRFEAKSPALEIRYTKQAAPLTISHVKTRPLKEAMVTVGGVDLDDVDAETMASKRIPNLYFAGEVLDIDGPTGGYNLTAAFATARLAIDTIAKEGNFTPAPVKQKQKRPSRARKNHRYSSSPRPKRRRS